MFSINRTEKYHKHSTGSLKKCHPVKRLKSLNIKPTIWDDIVTEDKEFENFIRKENLKNIPTFECASGYIKRQLFPCLVPAFERVCAVTLKNGVLVHPVRFFNFIDALAEVLYNTNPAHRERKHKWTSIHLIHKNQDRPYYPYHWFLTRDGAATLIQAAVRGFLTRRKYDLRAIKEERKKVLESIGKQQKCYINIALREEIQNMHK